MTRIAFIALMAGFLISCAPASRFPEISDTDAGREAELQRQLVIEQRLENDHRTMYVAHRVLTAGVYRCRDNITRRAGFYAVHNEMFGQDFSKATTAITGAGSRITVTYAPLDLPAGKAGIRKGDIITAINDNPVPDKTSGMSVIGSTISESEGPLTISVIRQGQALDIIVPPDMACDYPVQNIQDDAVNAFADGRSIRITTGMLRFTESDDELALIIGHELAHNTETHIAAKTGNAIIGGLLGAVLTGLTGVNMVDPMMNLGGAAFSQDFEAEADYIGVYYAAAAGYDVKEAAKLWRRMGAAHPSAIHLDGTSHPSSAKRFVAIEKTVKEIQLKKDSGEPIEPSQSN